MVKKYMLLLLALASLQASELLIQNIPGRQTTTLNGVWNYIVDPYENGFYNYRYTPFDDYGDPSQSGGYFTNQKPVNPWDRIEYDFDKSEAIIVPGDWNSQKEKLYYYEGTIWYKRSFDYEKTRDDNRVFVHFGAINYKADVYLNGQKLGVHKGGFTPFNFEITDIVRPKDNFLIVKVDNTRKKDEVPTVNTDWWNFGGLTRDVSLIEVSSTFVSDYFIQLEKGSKRDIKGYIQLDGEDKANRKVIVDIPGLRLKKSLTTDVEGSAELELNSREIKFWSPDNPMLYDINIQLDTEVLSDRIGFRTLATRNSDILLNGESIFLRGICIQFDR